MPTHFLLKSEAAPKEYFAEPLPSHIFGFYAMGYGSLGCFFLLVGNVFRSFFFCQFFDAQNLAALTVPFVYLHKMVFLITWITNETFFFNSERYDFKKMTYNLQAYLTKNFPNLQLKRIDFWEIKPADWRPSRWSASLLWNTLIKKKCRWWFTELHSL